ncbi:hypothetical protein HDU80_007819, partial [Chytriomyces hyalinus]
MPRLQATLLPTEVSAAAIDLTGEVPQAATPNWRDLNSGCGNETEESGKRAEPIKRCKVSPTHGKKRNVDYWGELLEGEDAVEAAQDVEGGLAHAKLMDEFQAIEEEAVNPPIGPAVTRARETVEEYAGLLVASDSNQGRTMNASGGVGAKRKGKGVRILTSSNVSTAALPYAIGEFFLACFGIVDQFPPFDTSFFVSCDLSKDVVSKWRISEKVAKNEGFIWNVRPYVADLISRRLPIDATFVQLFNAGLKSFSSRDLMIAFIHSMDTNLRPRIVSDIVNSIRPVPVLMDDHYKMGIATLEAMPNTEVPATVFLSLSFAGSVNTKDILSIFFPTRGERLYDNSENGICLGDSVDFLVCKEGVMKAVPVVLADVHVANAEHNGSFTQLVRSLASSAFYVSVSLTDKNYKLLPRLLSLLRKDVEDVEVSCIVWHDLGDSELASLEKNLSDFAKTEETLQDFDISLCIQRLGAATGDLKKCAIDYYSPSNKRFTRFSALVASYTGSEESTKSMAAKFHDVQLPKTKEAVDKWLQTTFPLGDLDNQIGELKLIMLGKRTSKHSNANTVNNEITNLTRSRVEVKPSPAVKLFADIVKKQSLKYLREFRHCVSTLIAPIIAKLVPDTSVDISLFWRELILASNVNVGPAIVGESIAEKTLLFTLYGLLPEELFQSFLLWAKAGEPIQFVLSNNLTLDPEFVTRVFCRVQEEFSGSTSSLFIIGGQSGGKSTLLNRVFSSSFFTSSGRCTRGLYLSFRRTMLDGPRNFILLDSEGLEGTERKLSDANESTTKYDSVPFDTLMAILSLTTSHILLINNKGEMRRTFSDLLDVAFFDLGTQFFKPIGGKVKVHIALRDIAGTADHQEMREQTIKHLGESLASVQRSKSQFFQLGSEADNLVDFNADRVHALVNAYNSEQDKDLTESTNIKIDVDAEFFGREHISELRKSLLTSAVEGSSSANDYISTLRTMIDLILTKSNFSVYSSHHE